jgi:hypothetical protein
MVSERGLRALTTVTDFWLGQENVFSCSARHNGLEVFSVLP